MIETITRYIIERLRVGVLANTVQGTHSDVQEIAQLPVLIVYLPTATPTRLDCSNEPEVIRDEGAGTVQIVLPPGYYDLAFDYEIIAETSREALQIGQALLAWFGAHPYLQIEGGEYPLWNPEPLGPPGRTSPENLRRVAGRFIVENVEIPSGITYTGKPAKEFQSIYINERGGTDTIQYSLKRG